MTQFESRQSEKVIETATEARQGSYGRPVLMVLVCSLILALLAWGGVEMWGERQDTDTNTTASTKQDPINSHHRDPAPSTTTRSMVVAALRRRLIAAPTPRLWRHTNTFNDAKRLRAGSTVKVLGEDPLHIAPSQE